MKTVGIISDTHAKLPDSALNVFKGSYAVEQVICHECIDAADEGIALPAPCDLIAHAGDIGYADSPKQWVLDRLLDIAPLIAVAGNCDYPEDYEIGGKILPLYAVFEVCGVSFAMLHEPQNLKSAVRGSGTLNPAYITPLPRVLVHGHTHEQGVNRAADETVTICPGSISRPRGGNPPTVAIVKVEEPGQLLSVDIVAV